MNKQYHVRFGFDPACPWAWRASRWIKQAARVRPLEIEWGVLSLAYLNRESWDAAMRERGAQWQPALRLLAAVGQHAGNAALDRLYWTLGEAVHIHQAALADRDVLRSALRAAELDENLLATADDRSWDAQIDAHSAAAQAAGAFGVPTVYINDNPTPYFGPVIDRVPEGQEAGELWDHVLWMADHPFLLELKRSRSS